MSVRNAGSLAVVVASWQPLDSLAACLRALSVAAGSSAVDVIVVRAVRDAAERDAFQRVVGGHRGARAVEAEAGSDVAELRALGTRAASAEFVAWIEDQCRPPAGWCEAAVELAGRWGAVGGVISNLSRGSLVDRAAYFAEYGAQAPLARGEDVRSEAPSGANAAYRREPLLSALEDFPGTAPWEEPLHAALARRGIRPVTAARLTLGQERRVGLATALRERFHHGRLYAAERLARAPGGGAGLRLRRAIVAPLIPAALLLRTGSRAWRADPQHRRDFFLAAPLCLVLFGAWAAGELLGYAAAASPPGAGRAAAKSLPLS